jgi:hypothetical protein
LLGKEQVAYMLGDYVYAKDKDNRATVKEKQTSFCYWKDEQPVAFAAYSPREEDENL